MHLKNPAELVQRLELVEPPRLLLVDVPGEVVRLIETARPAPAVTRETNGDSIRSVKENFDAVLVWRESRTGSRAVFDAALRRLEASAPLWIVTVLKKVRGPETPAVHRLELSDLVKAFEKEGFTQDREVRVSAWHVAYRFVRRGP